MICIPDELKEMRNWVCVNNGSKVPLQPTGRPASTREPATWSTWGAVEYAVRRKWFDGVGFVFNRSGIVGIDIDDGFDEEGFITAKAADIILNCRSYTEVSRSGRGFHILIRGHLPFGGRNNRDGVEAYQTGRYFILTGDVVPGYDTISDNQAAIDYVVKRYFPEEERTGDGPTGQRVYSPCWKRPDGRRIPVRPIYPDIPNGSRNICLTSLGGLMRSIGYTGQQIRHELEIANREACKPPLDTVELNTIVRSVTRYKR